MGHQNIAFLINVNKLPFLFAQGYNINNFIAKECANNFIFLHMKITIIGQPCSGKSTLAARISEKFNIPHIQIDRFWFEARGQKIKSSDKERIEKARGYVRQRVEEALKQDSWVSDGWYSRVQPLISEQADQIIFLVVPLYRRLFNHFKRINKPGRYKELTAWDEIKFFYEIIKRTFTKSKKIKKFAREHKDKVKILKNYEEVEAYFKSLT